MSRGIQRLALGLGGALAVLVALISLAVAVAAYRPGVLRPLIERLLQPPGGSASLADLEVDLWPPLLVLQGLELRWTGTEDRLHLERLRAVPHPGRLLGAGPWLRELEIQGLEVRRRVSAAGTSGPPDLAPLAWLFAVEDLSIREARFDLEIGAAEVTLEGLSLSLTPAAGAARTLVLETAVGFGRPGGLPTRGRLLGTGRLTPDSAFALRLELAVPGLGLGGLRGDLTANATLALRPERLDVGELTLELADALLSLPSGKEWALGAVGVSLGGGVGLDGSEPRFELSRIEVGDLLRGRGSLSGRSLIELSGWLEGTLPDLALFKPGLPALLPAGLRDLEPGGELPFRLEGSAGREGVSLSLELQPEQLALAWPTQGLQVRLGGLVRLTPPTGGSTPQKWLETAVKGRLEAVADLAYPPLAVRSVRLVLPLAGSLSALRSPAASLSMDADQVSWNDRVLPLGPVSVRGSLALDGAAVRVDALRVESEALGRLEGEIALGEGLRRGRLNGEALPVRALADLLWAADLSGQAWAVEGAVDFAARLEPTEGGERLAAELRLQGAGFSSPDGELLAQGLGGDLALEWVTGPAPAPGNTPRLEGRLRFGQGEALWDTVYLDLSRSPFDLRLGVTPSGDLLEAVAAEAELQGFAHLSLTGDLRREQGRWRHRGRLVVDEAVLEPLFQTFVRDPLAASRPELGGLQAGGTGKLDLAFEGLDGDVDLRGRLEVRSAGLAAEGEPAMLSEVDLVLPLAYALGRTRETIAPPEGAAWGRLRLQRLAVAGMALGPLDLPVALVPNRLYLGGTLEIPLLEGRLVLRRIRLEEPLSPAFRAALAVEVEALDLGRIPIEGLTMEGKLGGVLDPVRVDAQELAATGTLTGELFGGRLEVSGLAVRHPFAARREVAGDFEATGMDLERLSGALDVGRITGRVSASLTGLRMAYGQPVAFHLRAVSQEVEGVEQQVSLKAVNAISLLGTGSALGGAGVSFMTSLFRQFPYDRIGFECDLENDVFTVRGLIRENEVEYLVKRPFLGGINVINQNPNNRIRFSDMVRRLERLTQESDEPEPRP
ncbi:MAG: hypothetical protein ACYDA8_06865 [Deferrisomatales bacterium]